MISHDVCWKVDQFAWMGAATISIEMVNQLFHGDIGVERSGMMEVPLLPDFVRCVVDEFGGSMFRCIVRGIVSDKEGVLSLALSTDDGGSIISDGGIGGRARGDGKWVAPSCHVQSGRLNDAD